MAMGLATGFALPRLAAATTLDIGPAGPAKITATNGTVTVPITLSQFTPPSGAGNGAKGFQVTVALSAGLKFAQSLGLSILPGPYLTGTGACPNSAGDPSPIFSATHNADNTVTIVAALNPGKCAQCPTAAFPGGGVVFNLVLGTTLPIGSTSTEHVTLTGSPAGAVTPSPTLQDCSNNAALPVSYGIGDAPVLIDIPSPTTFDIGPASPGTIIAANGTVTVPITLSQFTPPSGAGNGAKGFQVTVALSAGLKFAQSLGLSILPGPYLTGIGPCPNSAGDPTPIFSATQNADNTVTIVAALNPGKCAQCPTAAFPGGGIVFNLVLGTTLAAGSTSTEHVTLTGSPAGAVTPSPTLQDCSNNAALSVGYGVTDAPILVQLPPPLELSVDGTDPACAGAATGSITANASGGTPPYTYSKDSITFQSSNVFPNLAAGPYTITVKDATGATTTAPKLLVDPPVLTLTLDGTNPACAGEATGSITANAGGGTPPYTYSKDGTTFQASNVFPNLAAGPYTITVKDAHGCKKTDSKTLVDPPALTLTLDGTNPTCAGEATGSITANAGGGTPPYTYSKDGTTFQASNVFPNLAAGPYTITVKDAHACTKTDNKTLVDPPALTLTLDGTNPACAGEATGSITANAGGGTPPYTYSKDGTTFQSSNVFPNLAAGPYTITVKDAHGCKKTDNKTLVDPPALTLTLDSTNPTCAGEATGSITANAGGGTPPYTYSKDGTTFQSSNVFPNLAAGPYTITVKDAHGCKKTANATLTGSGGGGALTLSVVATPATLWPPDKKLHDIHVTATVTGGCGATTLKLESISLSCPPDNHRPRPDVIGAYIGTADVDFLLRARQCEVDDHHHGDDDDEEKCEERCESQGESEAEAACDRDCDDIKDRVLREQCRKEQKACEEKFLSGWDDHCDEECEKTRDLIYTIVYSVMDGGGLQVTASTTVRVQHAAKAHASIASGPGDPSNPGGPVGGLPLNIIIPSIPRVSIPSGSEMPDAVDHSLQGAHASALLRLAGRSVDPSQILIGNSTVLIPVTGIRYADVNGDGFEDVVGNLRSKEQLSLQHMSYTVDDPITLYFRTLSGKGYQVTDLPGLIQAPPVATPRGENPPPRGDALSGQVEAPEVRTTQLVRAYPNPSHGRLSMVVDLAQAADSRVEVFDLRGALIRTLMRGSQAAGRYEVTWDGLDAGGRAAPNGLYLVRMRAGAYRATRSVLLVR